MERGWHYVHIHQDNDYRYCVCGRVTYARYHIGSCRGYIRADVDGNFAISGYMDFAPMAAPAWKEGRMFYDSGREGFSIYVKESDITGNVMEEEWRPVWNDTGVQIDDGTPVYVTGSLSGLATVAPAIANGQRVIGLATHDIPDGTRGKVTRGGDLTGPDYTSFSDGDVDGSGLVASAGDFGNMDSPTCPWTP